jgi:hypothetical protein
MAEPTSYQKLRAERDEAIEVAALFAKAYALEVEPPPTVASAIRKALDLPADRPRPQGLGETALQKSQETATNRRIVEAIIFRNDEHNDVAKQIEKGRSRATKKNDELRRGTKAWREAVIARADARAKSGDTILNGKDD